MTKFSSRMRKIAVIGALVVSALTMVVFHRLFSGRTNLTLSEDILYSLISSSYLYCLAGKNEGHPILSIKWGRSGRLDTTSQARLQMSKPFPLPPLSTTSTKGDVCVIVHGCVNSAIHPPEPYIVVQEATQSNNKVRPNKIRNGIEAG